MSAVACRCGLCAAQTQRKSVLRQTAVTLCRAQSHFKQTLNRSLHLTGVAANACVCANHTSTSCLSGVCISLVAFQNAPQQNRELDTGRAPFAELRDPAACGLCTALCLTSVSCAVLESKPAYEGTNEAFAVTCTSWHRILDLLPQEWSDVGACARGCRPGASQR